ncbi:MAG: lipopolysaccharide biosynthesis protein [Magnetococcales bacterium]|nr:lipopolysaccharide biosynthesis protein [Magnetococcales bacterium]
MLVFVQGLILIPIIIKVAGEEIYGSYVLVLAYMGVLFAISSFGITFSCRRWLPTTQNNEEKGRVFLPQFWFQLSVALMLAVAGGWLYVHFVAPALQSMSPSLWLLPIYLGAYTVYSQTADYFRDTHRIGVFTMATTSQPYLFISICLSAYWFGRHLDLELLVGSLIVTYSCIGLVLFVRIVREVGCRVSWPTRQDLQAGMTFGMPMLATSLLEIVLSNGDKFIIGSILSVRDVGMYVPAYTIGLLIMLFPRIISAVLLPMLSRECDAGEEHKAAHILKTSAKVYLLIAIPYAVGSMVLAHDLLRLYTNLAIADASYRVVSLVAVAAIFNGLILLKSSVLFVRLDTRFILNVNLIMAGVSSILNIVLLSLFHQVWVSGVAVSLSYLMGYGIVSWKLKADVMNFHVEWGWLLVVLSISCVMGILVYGLRHLFAWGDGVGSLIGQMMAGVAIYLLCIGGWYAFHKATHARAG